MQSPEIHPSRPVRDVLGLILGGGRGTRLYPLTRYRAKPAVPLLGQYRLIDIPISNCLDSAINRIYVLTQFNSVSLLRHIANTYNFDVFSDAWVEILPAQQTLTDGDWYQGTADAVRQNLRFVLDRAQPLTLILSGDQLYRMDFSSLVQAHCESGADATICCTPVSAAEAPDLGLVKADAAGKILEFAEKPNLDDIDPGFQISGNLASGSQPVPAFLASMGIYLFSTEALIEALESHPECDDFGSEVIPRCLGKMDLRSFYYRGYWEDIGTIGSFYEANLELASRDPVFDFYVQGSPVYTRPRFLPPPRMRDCAIKDSIVGAGSEIHAESIEDSVIGVRSCIGTGTRIRRAVIMGADFYETDGEPETNGSEASPSLGIGENCLLENCIIDKNPRIGEGVKIVGKERPKENDNELYSVRDGIVVIPKDSVIPAGTVI